MTETKTHDYTRRSWGHNFTITEFFNGGMWLDMMGWGHGLSKGDFIILPNGNETTRYLIKNIEYKSNPPDMWRAKVEFAPRARLARDVMQDAGKGGCIMTITTEEAERLAATYVSGARSIVATALRFLAAERDALRAEKVNLQDDLASVERERAHQHGRADRNAAEYAREQKKREQLQAENARLREALARAKNLFLQDEPRGAFIEVCAALGETQ